MASKTEKHIAMAALRLESMVENPNAICDAFLLMKRVDVENCRDCNASLLVCHRTLVSRLGRKFGSISAGRRNVRSGKGHQRDTNSAFDL